MSMEKRRGETGPEWIELHFLENVSKRLPEDLQVLQALAELYTRTEQYEDGLALDRRLSRLLPGDAVVWYNLGCSYALTRRFDDAFEALAKAIELGYSDYDWMKGDRDLANLHADPRFESLLNWLYTVCSNE